MCLWTRGHHIHENKRRSDQTSSKRTPEKQDKVKMQKESAYYIPCGWVVAERAVPNHPLIFGMRKSLFFRGSQCKDLYVACRELMKEGGSDVQKMVQIAELLEQPLTT